ncbi:S1C family serine protease, partial [Pseudactinotalea suaedae]|uniref:S1C family serine protease n=1 Tax=Pseudactinotalea suaedae TaxID=1524924 RepID=UPI0012E295CB
AAVPQPVTGGAAPPPARAGRRRSGVPAGVVVLLMLLSLLAGTLAGIVGHRWLFPAESAPSGLPTLDQTGAVGDPVGDTWISEIASVALPSTVYIEVRGGGGEVSGSGFVVREDGYIVTNHHVIAGAVDGDGEITIVFSDGTESPAEVVGSTADYDLAVLKIDRDGLVPLVLGDSDTLVVGDPVIAVGAPLGLSGSVTAGIVSARDRPVTVRNPDASGDDPSSYINAVQTDAAINRGNSGGPLIDADGLVIGVNTAVARDGSSGGGGNEPGFAIPSNQVRHTVEQIIETGQASYPVIGVLLDSEYQGEGVRVSIDAVNGTPAVTPGGPAEQAGIEPGDVIVAVDGEPVSQPTELIVRVRAHVPGDVIVLTVRADDDDEHDVEVVLGEAVSR